jgi:hypothetical protein
MNEAAPQAATGTDSGDDPVWTRRMLGLVASHPTLEWLKPVNGIGPHVAIWQEDDGAKREEREHLGDLVLYLKCRLGRH